MIKTPILYIFMRSDLDSMNPGKACAQASHATSMFELDDPRDYFSDPHVLAKWRGTHLSVNNGRDFGTTLVFAAPFNHLMKFYDNLGQLEEIMKGWVYDPTYPIKDGAFTHHVPVQTCFYVFAYKEDMKSYIDFYKLELMK